MKKSFIKIVSVLTAGTLALGGVPVMAEDNKTADLSAEDVISAQDMATRRCSSVQSTRLSISFF